MNEFNQIYRQIFEQSPYGIVIADADTLMPLAFNDRILEQLSYTREAFSHSSIIDLAVDLSVADVDSRIKSALAQGHGQFEVRLHTGNDEIRDFMVSVQVIKLQEQRLVYATFHNISVQKKALKSIENLSFATSSRTGDELYQYIVQRLGKSLDADYAYIGQLTEGTIRKISILSLWGDDAFHDNFIFDLAGTPCEQVSKHYTCVYPSRVAEQFPQDLQLQELGINGYIGTALRNKTGNFIGILAVLYRRPIVEPDFVQSLFQAFAARATAELERELIGLSLTTYEKEFSGMITAVPGVIYRHIVTPNGQYYYDFISEGVQELLGISQADAVKQKDLVMNLLISDDRVEIRKRYTDLTDKNIPWTAEFHIQSPTGIRKWVRINSIPDIVDEDGTVMWNGMMIDITEEKNTQQALSASETRFRTLFESSRDALMITTPDSRLIDCNEAALRLFGFTDATELGYRAVLARSPRFQSNGKVSKDLAEKYRAEVRTSGSALFEWVYRRADGSLFPAEVLLSEYHIDNELVHQVTIRDVSERKRAELELQRYQHIVANSSDLLAYIDKDFRYQAVNDAHLKLFNRSREAIIGKTLRELVGDHAFETAKPWMERCFQGQHVNYQPFVPEPVSGIEFVDINYDPHFDRDGSVAGIVASVRDITEQKRAELALIKTQKLFQQAEEQGKLGYWEWDDVNDVLLDCSEQYASIFGYSVAEMIANYGTLETELMLVHPQDRQSFVEFWNTVYASAEPDKLIEREYRIITSDGSTCHVYERSKPVFDQQGRCIRTFGTLQDITERKRMEQALAESELHFRTLASHAPVGIFRTDEQGHVVYANTLISDLTGVELDGPQTEYWDGHIHPDDRQRVQQRRQLSLKNKVPFSEEYRFQHTNGKAIWVSSIAVPEFDSDNQFTGFVGMMLDITEHKKTDELLRNRMEQQRTLAHLGTLAFSDLSLAELMQEVLFHVAHCLHADFCKVLELLPDGKQLLLRTGVGRHENNMVKAIIDVDPDTQAGYTLASRKPVVVDDLANEKRFSGPTLLPDHKVISGISVIIGDPDKPYGVLGVHTRDKRQFNEDDIHFLQTVASVIGQAIARNNAQEKLFRADQALIDSEERYRTIIESSNEWIWEIDTERRHVYSNQQIEAMLGYSIDEIIGKEACDFMMDSVRNKILKQWPDIVEKKQGWENKVFSWLHKKGGLRYLESSARPKLDENGNLTGFIGAARDITERIHTEHEIYNSRERIRNLANQLQSVREEERSRIAREIHDELAQAMTGLRMDLSWLYDHLPRRWLKLPGKVRSMIELTEKTLQISRKIAFQLRPSILDDLGLQAAIEWEVMEYVKRMQCDYALNINVDRLRKSSERDTAIFRVLQECLSNIARHAAATRIEVSLYFAKANMVLTVMDNGIGITKENIGDVKSVGLTGMQERASVIRANLEITNPVNGGTLVTLIVPAVMDAS